MEDFRSCEYFFLPLDPRCTTTTTSTSSSTTSTTTTEIPPIPVTTTTTSSTSTSTTSTTSSTSTTTTSTTSTTSTTTTIHATTTTTTTTIAPQIYGLLYNWFAAHDTRLAQAGWHVATSTEWFALGLALGGSNNYPSVYSVSQKMKTPGNLTDGTGLWKKSINPGVEGTNSSGLTVNPAGVVHSDGSPGARTTDADFWCSDDQSGSVGKYFNLNYSTQTLYRNTGVFPKNYGFSIRLVKDTGTTWNPGDTYTDYDGNVYTTAMMADGKVWLTQNLRVQHYNDGVLLSTNPSDWSTRITGAIHTYN